MPNEQVVIATTSNTPQIPGLVFDFYTPLMNFLDAVGGAGAGEGIFGFLSSLWSVWVVIAYIASALFVYGYIYASMRYAQLGAVLEEGIELQVNLYQKTQGAEVKNQRWQELVGHLESDNPNDWKLAIIEADVLLDEATKERGYAGNTLGERLRSISPSQMQTLSDAWDAHIIRNKIAHGGADFVLTQKLARQTVTQYQRVFQELDLI